MSISISLKNVWKNNKGFITFLVLMVVVRTGVADWYNVPTGSMKPTIVEGDRILVNKLAYQWKVPFTSLVFGDTALPARGDIVVFNSEAANERLIKRVVGLPGDEIAMKNNVLLINGQTVKYHNLQNGIVDEGLPGHAHQVQFVGDTSALANFGPVRVPKNHVLVLGDNRNNSADSRVYGFVPTTEIVGRANRVLFSLKPDEFYLPRVSRTLDPLI